MAYKNGSQPAHVALSYEGRDALKRLASLIGFLAGKPVTYNEAIADAERIVREHVERERAATCESVSA